MTLLVHEKEKKQDGTITCARYPSSSDKWVRVKPPVFFRLCEMRRFWQGHRQDNFSQGDAIKLLLDFYEQFYPRHREEFKK